MAPTDHRPSRLLRIGQIVPSSNTTMETEIPAMLRAREQHFPERFTFHSSRMRMKRVSHEELAAMNQEGLRCAAELADARVDVMSTACLVAIMAQGPGIEHANAEAVVLSACVQMQSLPAIQAAEKMLGLPVTSTSVCTVRNMLDLLELEPRIPNCGSLLQ